MPSLLMVIFHMLWGPCCVPDIPVKDRPHLVKVLKDIIQLGSPYYSGSLVTKIDKSCNRAAAFLAKRGEKKEYRHDQIPCVVLEYFVKMECPGRYELHNSVTEQGKLYRN